jgi:hypothetical protein
MLSRGAWPALAAESGLPRLSRLDTTVQVDPGARTCPAPTPPHHLATNRRTLRTPHSRGRTAAPQPRRRGTPATARPGRTKVGRTRRTSAVAPTVGPRGDDDSRASATQLCRRPVRQGGRARAPAPTADPYRRLHGREDRTRGRRLLAGGRHPPTDRLGADADSV